MVPSGLAAMLGLLAPWGLAPGGSWRIHLSCMHHLYHSCLHSYYSHHYLTYLISVPWHNNNYPYNCDVTAVTDKAANPTGTTGYCWNWAAQQRTEEPHWLTNWLTETLSTDLTRCWVTTERKPLSSGLKSLTWPDKPILSPAAWTP